jgi:hypothetical protein
MKVRIALIACGLSVLLLLGIAPMRADTRVVCDETCPLCGQKFQARLAASGTQFGQRLDLRPIGPIASPWPLAVCPKCGFVLYKDDNKYAGEELKALRKVVASDEYKKLGASAPTYARLAKLHEGLKSPPCYNRTHLSASVLGGRTRQEAEPRPVEGELAVVRAVSGRLTTPRQALAGSRVLARRADAPPWAV